MTGAALLFCASRVEAMFGAPLKFEGQASLCQPQGAHPQAPAHAHAHPHAEDFTEDRKTKAALSFANLTTPTMSGGLYGHSDQALPGLIWYRFDQGYFEDKPLWFKYLKPSATGSTLGWTDLNQVGPGDNTPDTLPIGKKVSFSILIKGYFVPKVTGAHYFIMGSDDSSYLWWGQDAATVTQDKTMGTAIISLPGKRSRERWWQLVTLRMTAGTAYPLSIMYGQNLGAWHLVFAFKAPDQDKPTQDGTGYFYGRVAAGTTIAASVEVVDRI